MKFTNTDSVEEKFYNYKCEQWDTPFLWESEVAPVFFQVYSVTDKIQTKIEQELRKWISPIQIV